MSLKALTPAAAFAAPLLLTSLKSLLRKGATPPQEEKKRNVLPTNVVPVHYSVDLAPNLTTFAVDGLVKVNVKVTASTKVVVLHSKGLSFSQASVATSNGTNLVTKSVTFDKQNETACLVFGSELAVGVAVLTIRFTGELSEQLNGFYRSKYTKDGEERYMGTTQFEATHARQAFPCWDEPLVKATFEIILRVPNDRDAISNMPVVEEKQLGNGLKMVRYDKTPVMSTYLLAWVVGEFEYVEETTKEGVLVRVYTQHGKTEQGKFALSVGCKILSFFSEYFDIGFPLPKLDMIAIPDFAAGAMENWGLVTYRETALLYEEGKSSKQAQARVAYVVAHELAHQWFGNLVSPSWWKYLWLNEGFATWAGVLATDHCFPEWDEWTKFVASYVLSAFTADSLASSHPIEVEVMDAGEINEIFDAISYYKGSSVIRMLANYLGADTFRNGLRTYLKEKQYACASTEDLWRHCSLASGKDVAGVMDNWIKITGYPFVEVGAVRGEDLNSSCVRINFKQSLFLSTGVSNVTDSPVWVCPVTVAFGCSTGEVKKTQAFELTSREQTFDFQLPAGVSHSDDWWIKVNLNVSAFYRVKYDSSLLTRLVPVLSSLVSSVDRMSVQSDMFAMAKAGAANTADALKLASGYRKEQDYSIWSDLTSSLANLRNIFDLLEVPCNSEFKNFLVWLYGPISKCVGWEPKPGESQSTTLLRSLVISTAGKAGDKDIVLEAQKRFAAHINGTKEIAADLRSAVYNIAVGHGGAKEFDDLLELLRKAEGQEEKVRIMSCMAATKDESKLTQLLDLMFTDEIRNQDAIHVIRATAGNPKGREVAWQWEQKNWDKVVATWGGGQMMLPHFIKGACGGFASKQKLDEVNKFFEGRDVSGAERALAQAKESIELVANWIDRDLKGVTAFLASGPHK
mmetsp:Transcript_15282/g.30037  ORF Transcript_15282/g.30037 Transcript_15282/m.30037 type:complete len:912 (+) Transcript_15282:45-2780(+)|eukprot:CAMPEP_0175137810 /NCGR_PEP_ID=MMETSP0087-20121206/10009_1 /TAXON_ID=136419 /ORGANISM="Unknown Unknown, Strain D1" /LENGTH=911 /DNA_ID=CAMNT_0016420661 /DNA_START=45 /DNA_END=2780 /DNA_ORIENTATION=-